MGGSNSVRDGETCGTTGISTPLTEFSASVEWPPSSSLSLPHHGGLDGGVRYCAHVSYVGWTPYAADGAKTGNGHNQMEAVRIELTGDLARSYSVEYSVHVAGVGWMGWCADGAVAGTTGQSCQLEAIRVRLVKRKGK
jgi:hypothetical protein